MLLEEHIYAMVSMVPEFANRVFPDVAFSADGGEVPRPFCVYTIIFQAENALLDGDEGTEDALVQIDVYADDKAEAARLAKKVRDALNAGNFISFTTESGDSSQETDTKYYRCSRDYRVIFSG